MDVKRIFLFGATGPTGKQALQQALESGHKVTALARNPDALADFKKHENFEVKEGDALESGTFEQHMADCDVVMSCLGGKGLKSSGVPAYSNSMKEINKAMEKNGITRFIGMTSWGTRDDQSLPFLIRWVMRPLFIGHILDNMHEMEEFLQTTKLNYTVVRPPGLKNGPSSGKKVEVMDDALCVPGCSISIPRADVAEFMLSCLKTDKHDKKIVAIGIK